MKKGELQRKQVASHQNITLVKYENPQPRDIFDLTTIHSLLIDNNDKFRKLKQLINDYNKKQTSSTLSRPHFDRKFIERLFSMLCQVVRICHYENQLDYLNKIYMWAFQTDNENEDQDFANDQQNYDGQNNNTGDEKMRPNTASTRTRPYSAATTHKIRPDSGVPTNKYSIPVSKKSTETDLISQNIMGKYPDVDFKQLKLGQKQFFQGHRTMHPEYDRPKIRLKEYHRKILYNQNEDEQDQGNFKPFIEQAEIIHEPISKMSISSKQKVNPLLVKLSQEEKKKKEELADIILNKQMNIEGQNKQLRDAQGNLIQGVDGQPQDNQQGMDGVGDQDVNIDDLVGDEDGGIIQQEQQEIIDKLKPHNKPYQGKPKGVQRRNQPKFYGRLQDEKNNRNKVVRDIIEDDTGGQLIMKQWASIKNKVKVQQNRRAESMRLVNRHPGIAFQAKKQNQVRQTHQQFQIIDLTQTKICETKIKTRPKTAFKPESQRVYSQQIKNAMISGKLASHIPVLGGGEQQPVIDIKPSTKVEYQNWVGQNRYDRIVSVGGKPKKKTFEEILRGAEERAMLQAEEQIDYIKQKLTSNKICIGGNKIAKSLTYHAAQIEDGEFVGAITGKNMLNNPYFKVAKKKKKKKKKK